MSEIIINRSLVERAIDKLEAYADRDNTTSRLIQDLLETSFSPNVGWISTWDRLPKLHELVLVYATEENVVISRISLGDNGWVWIDDGENTFALDTVKYWQPLPWEPN